MSNYLVVFRHGKGDHGTVGDCYQESIFTRNTLG